MHILPKFPACFANMKNNYHQLQPNFSLANGQLSAQSLIDEHRCFLNIIKYIQNIMEQFLFFPNVQNIMHVSHVEFIY